MSLVSKPTFPGTNASDRQVPFSLTPGRSDPHRHSTDASEALGMAKAGLDGKWRCSKAGLSTAVRYVQDMRVILRLCLQRLSPSSLASSLL